MFPEYAGSQGGTNASRRELQSSRKPEVQPPTLAADDRDRGPGRVAELPRLDPLAATGVARSFDAGRYNLAGPVVFGFVLTVCVLEQVFPAQRRPLLARGHLLDFCYAVFYALLVIPLEDNPSSGRGTA